MTDVKAPPVGGPGLVSYRYVARDPDGKRQRGALDAYSARGARTALMERGLQPVRVREKAGLNVTIGTRRVKQVELMHFSRQLAAFVRAGVPILEAFHGLADGMDNDAFKKALHDVTDALREGLSFTEALSEHPGVFPAYYTTAIQAAERTGNLDVTLERLAEYLERDVENRRKLKEALAYPTVVIVFAIIVVIVLTVVVMPRFQGLFASLGTELPLPTRMLVTTMDFLASWWWLLTALLVGGVLLVTSVSTRTERGRHLKDLALLNTPVIGGLVRTAIIERFCRSLGSMSEAAVPLPEALAIAGEGTQNGVFMSGIAEARLRMIQGAGIAEPLAATGLFPASALQMIRAGEQTGTLEHQLLRTADYYEKDLDYRLKRFTTMFEPAVIVFAGLVVGFVAVALVSAMYGVVRGVGL